MKNRDSRESFSRREISFFVHELFQVCAKGVAMI